jgi:hypothetical protein
MTTAPLAMTELLARPDRPRSAGGSPGLAGLAGEQALARFGRAIGLPSEALRNVPLADAPHDWRGDPLGPHPEMPGRPG